MITREFPCWYHFLDQPPKFLPPPTLMLAPPFSASLPLTLMASLILSSLEIFRLEESLFPSSLVKWMRAMAAGTTILGRASATPKVCTYLYQEYFFILWVLMLVVMWVMWQYVVWVLCACVVIKMLRWCLDWPTWFQNLTKRRKVSVVDNQHNIFNIQWQKQTFPTKLWLTELWKGWWWGVVVSYRKLVDDGWMNSVCQKMGEIDSSCVYSMSKKQRIPLYEAKSILKSTKIKVIKVEQKSWLITDTTH